MDRYMETWNKGMFLWKPRLTFQFPRHLYPGSQKNPRTPTLLKEASAIRENILIDNPKREKWIETMISFYAMGVRP